MGDQHESAACGVLHFVDVIYKETTIRFLSVLLYPRDLSVFFVWIHRRTYIRRNGTSRMSQVTRLQKEILHSHLRLYPGPDEWKRRNKLKFLNYLITYLRICAFPHQLGTEPEVSTHSSSTDYLLLLSS